MKFLFRTFVLVGCLLFLTSRAFGIGETGAQFLKIGVGARACAMGEAFVGVADDATAIYWNPAGLRQLNKIEILGMQNFWLLDMSYQYVAASFPLPFGSIGVAGAYSSSGKIPKYEDFQKVGDYTAYDALATVAYANKIGGLHYGVGLKLIQQKIEEEDARGFAGDVGLLYKIAILNNSLNLGLAVQNIGPGIKFIEKADPLPLNIKTGASFGIGAVVVAVDANKPRDNDLRFNFGGEFTVKEVMALRAGYNTANSFSAGIGLTYQRVSIDYAFAPYKEIDATHCLSARFRF